MVGSGPKIKDCMGFMKTQDISSIGQTQRVFDTLLRHKEGNLCSSSFIEKAQEIVSQDCAYMIKSQGRCRQ